MKNLANRLLETSDDATMSDLMEIVGTENAVVFTKSIDEMMLDIDTDLLKKIAIKFSGYRDFLSYEDILCERMGDDEYFEWADDNVVE